MAPLYSNGNPGSLGQVLTSQGLNSPPIWTTPASASIQNAWTTLIKPGDTFISSSTVLLADPDLRFPMVAGDIYAIRMRLFYDTTAAADFKWRHTGPAGVSLVRLLRQAIVPGATAFSGIGFDTAFRTSDITITGNASGSGYAEMQGIVQNGLTDGYFQISWAQNSSDSGQTVVRGGSLLEYAPYTPMGGI